MCTFEKYFKTVIKTKNTTIISSHIRRKAERLSIQEDKDTADHISKNAAYGQFARRFSYSGTTRAHQGCVLRGGQVIECVPDDRELC